MKKIFFMLLCAASVVLVSCKEKNEPTQDPTTPAEVTEGDFEVKFYTCDSLLKYYSYEVTCTDASIDCSGFKAARPNLTTSDSTDWKNIDSEIYVLEDVDLSLDNTQFIASKIHLKKGTSYTFKIHYTRNSTPVTTPEVDWLMGGSYHTTTSGLKAGSSYNPAIHGGVNTSAFATMMLVLNDYKLTISF